MAGKKENIKALFSNTRTRVIILFTIALVVTTVLIGVFKYKAVSQDAKGSVNLNRAPTKIHSIPGRQDQTAQYAELQNKQNIDQAVTASKKGSSAIPTIIKTQAFGEGVDLIGPQYGEGGPGFVTLSTSNLAGGEKSLWFQTLQQEHCSNRAIKEVAGKGATLHDLRQECNCCQLRQYGYTLQDLDPVCSCRQLKAAGFTAREMKVKGYTANQLRRCGFSACETRGAGFSADDMKEAGFTDGELKGSGFSAEAIAAASGLPDGVSEDDVRAAGCDPVKLAELRKKGVTASAIRRMSGCTPAQLKAAGYTADELKRSGMTAAELLAAGFSPEDLAKAGFSARDLMNAGLSPEELAKAGFSDDAIADAQDALPPGVTADQIRKAGCSVETLKRERAAGISAKMIHEQSGCSAEALKAAGFSDAALKYAGFTPAEIQALGGQELTDEQKTAVRAAGCDPDKLKALRASGVTAKQIRGLNGCSDEALKAAGFSPAEIQAAGGKELSDEQKTAVRAAGCDPDKLKALRASGVTAKQIHDLNGCSAAQLKAAGFSAKELADAGFTPAELLEAGFDSGALNSAGLIPSSVIAAGHEKGCTVEALKAARNLGVSATTIRETLGCSAAAMKAAGYSAQELKDAGFNAAELKAAGFSPSDLKAAGYSAQELKSAGVTNDELKALGLHVEEPSATPAAAGTATQGSSLEKIPSSGTASAMTRIPPLESVKKDDKGAVKSDTKQLQALMARQRNHVSDQQYQAKVKQVSGRMLTAANQVLQNWKNVSSQVFIIGSEKGDEKDELAPESVLNPVKKQSAASADSDDDTQGQLHTFIKTGDILFAVLDTSVNTDEPGPILATIVSGKLKGSKIIGSFTLPANADKMVVTFNTLSMLGADQTMGISAYAIDPSTARTALASRVNHHYLMRYGSLFASTFLAGFSSAIQSADTTITIGGTGGTTDTTVQNGINRSLLENALIGLGEVGKAWSETAQELMNRPTTIELFSGTGMGVLFTQDVQIA
jgi:intracellular multiplication protein IcmE